MPVSNTTRATLMVIHWVAALAAFAWVVSMIGGYRFGASLLVTFGAYMVILLAYACPRRIVQKMRIARAGKSPEVNRHG